MADGTERPERSERSERPGRLAGKKVALTGPRRSEELARLVENMGGQALLRPAQGTVFLDDESLKEGIRAWLSSRPEWAVFTTGVGLEALFAAAEEIGQAGELQQLLENSRIAARGYKTVNALRRRNLNPVIRDDDGSTEGLVRAWAALRQPLAGRKVMVQLHGDSAPLLVEWLEREGAEIMQLLPYRHIAPPEEQLEQLLSDVLSGEVDAVTFTSAPQVRFLLDYAERSGRLEALLSAFEGPVVAVSVGRITAQGLKEAGLSRVIAPQEERMGSMMVELAKFYASGNGTAKS
ncbi:uroporphyrinogen-III synthase [Paenibacillus yonginensis]|uniref:Uroporphyrinogen-III synthase n=1 Tax=Paenibacillus yonginensis TaxID=1462996 RepID=A0A1B1N445_9BACL|nr:uroporphyrinogen-III synthase [Paenibacillus yonginensis]ANS76187.1 uroporphyrinogen-III synthase [Paenibacillus yonginensis]